MKRRIGKALEDALAGGGRKGGVGGEKRPGVFSKVRWRLFSFYTLKPYYPYSGAAAYLKISPKTVSWHVRDMIASGLLWWDEGVFPPGLFPPEDSRIVRLLALPSIQKVIRFLSGLERGKFSGRKREERLGFSLGVLSQSVGLSISRTSRIVDVLEKNGLATKVRNGRRSNIYLTGLLWDLQESQQRRSPVFLSQVVKELSSLMGFVEVVRRGPVSVVLLKEGGRAGHSFSLRIGTNPYMTLLLSEEEIAL